MLKTLRSKLLFFFLITTFLSLLVVGYVSYESKKAVMTKQIEQSFFMFSDILSLNVEELISDTVNDVSYLSKNPILTNPTSDPEEIRAEFEKFVKHYPIYNDIIFVNSDGIVKIDMLDGLVEGNDFNDRFWFQQTMNGGTYFSDVYLSPVINKPILVVGATVKDHNDNILGAVSPAFDVDALWRRIYAFTDLQNQIGLNGVAFLFNDKGEIIAHPNTEKVMQEDYLADQIIDITHLNQMIDDKSLCFNEVSKEVSAYSKINQVPGVNNNWYIGVSVPESELFAPLHKLLVNYVIIFGLVLLMTCIAIIKFSNYLVLPIERLVATTLDLSNGKKFTPITVDSYKEINILSDQFNHMIEQLQERERMHRKSTLILETTDNGVFAIDKGTMRITTFNKTCEKIFNTHKNDVLFKDIREVCKLNQKLNTFIQQSNLVERIKNVPHSNEFECECSADNGVSYFLLEITELPKDNQQNEPEILIVFSELTEKKLMEKEMIRTEKLKVIGELSASFAHEIRNPLTTIRGFIQLMDVNENATDFEKRYYKVILQEIDRINGIVGDLMDMAKPNGDNQYIHSNLNELIDDITLLYDGQGSMNNVEFVKQLDKNVPSFFTYASKLKQVFINMIKNAFEAMPDGGALTIKTHYSQEENHVEIYISDTGIGMDEKTLSELGKPFFTTKETGTGLGMPMCHMIIEDLGGSIDVFSKLGEGTTFCVKLTIDEETYSSQNKDIKTVGF